jgi:hypothetical protein
LFCNWDDNQRRAASALAAYIVSASGYGGPRPAHLPPALAAESRRWVAWLCVTCMREPQTVRWFYRTVRRTYPGAVVVINPGSPREAPIRMTAI